MSHGASTSIASFPFSGHVAARDVPSFSAAPELLLERESPNGVARGVPDEGGAAGARLAKPAKMRYKVGVATRPASLLAAGAPGKPWGVASESA